MITQREIYLDSNATHPLLPFVREGLARAILEEDPALGNPSSIHRRGQKSKKAVAELRRRLCEAIGRGDGEEFVLLSGATEALNLAIRGFTDDRAQAGRKFRLITSQVEHSAVLDTFAARDPQAVYVGVTRAGELDGPACLAAIQAAHDRGEDVLLCLQAANNETGVAFALDELFAQIHARFAPRPITNLPKLKGGKYPTSPQRVWVLLDLAQAVGKLDPAHVRRALHFADYAALSAHKMGGPSGIGALWMRGGAPFKSQMTGGAQEKKRRAGTLNSLGALGFRLALEAWQRDGAAWRAQWRTLQQHLQAELGRIPGVMFHGLGPTGELPELANTLNFHVEGCPEESLLLALDLDGFAVSSGSACNSGSLRPSHVLIAMGYTREEALSAIRVCLRVETTLAEIDAFVDAVRQKSEHIRAARQRAAEWLPDIDTKV
jgi:cysteine desulfurase